MRWIAAALAVGCGGGSADDDDLGFPRACDESSYDGDCILFSGLGWISTDVVDACLGQVAQICPPSGGVGSCTVLPGEDFEAVTTFYAGFWSVAQAVTACQDKGGVWEETGA